MSSDTFLKNLKEIAHQLLKLRILELVNDWRFLEIQTIHNVSVWFTEWRRLWGFRHLPRIERLGEAMVENVFLWFPCIEPEMYRFHADDIMSAINRNTLGKYTARDYQTVDLLVWPPLPLYKIFNTRLQWTKIFDTVGAQIIGKCTTIARACKRKFWHYSPTFRILFLSKRSAANTRSPISFTSILST